MEQSLGKSEEDLLDVVVKEPSGVYESKAIGLPETYINPFEDWAFKRIFASETSKEVVKAFLNEILAGKRQIETISYGKNEYPGEIKEDATAVFDFLCTDVDGTAFLVEVQRQEQKYFKERSLFYTSRLISDQAPKGNKEWKYNLKEIYSISLLEQFCLPDIEGGAYMHNVSLCYTKTGAPFYDKLHFIYIEVKKFAKKEADLKSALDQWIYALKHAAEMSAKPDFLTAPELSNFFYLAKYASLTKEERNMYRTAQQVKWDNQNVMDFQIEKARESASQEGRQEGLKEGLKEGREEGREEERLKALAEKKEIALQMKQDGVNIERIVKYTKLSKEQIDALI
ncbi:Rpn family recombination-promoting nuclease/putative transposase [Pedobacter psychroterrae]|uniref:Rpn family recombination-promoting nuclease/putative transposase n=1 Tax=Pedobacter psychroterrae TaxID=2530453 RepID=A0A4R0NHL2_9SPHI|nr:Rpn family recombination-promoting nuclease/putative transposase [Pedobacter psychroterrae]TCD00072.1 Rpn family recombination-promoting nuclease/putative transposase [Pedobacter psychroterrae]